MSFYGRARTLSVVKELARGRQLILPDGRVVAMGEDMSIGFVITDSNGEDCIGSLSTMDLRRLNRLLDENDIGKVIPVMFAES